MNTPRPAAFAIRFITRSLVALLLLVSCPIQALAQSPWIITNSSPYSLGAKATQPRHRILPRRAVGIPVHAIQPLARRLILPNHRAQ